MGDLPCDRVTPLKAFTNTGIDFCGPIYIRERRRRGARRVKAYVVVFFCMIIKAILKVWRDSDIIDDYTYKLLKCTNRNLPRCYGLPKIHKIGFPLRLIVSSLGSPFYNVERFIHDILLTSVPKPKSFVK